MVTATGLSKKFGSVQALSDINLSIAPGEFVFLTGPSGSGKTTLLRLILRDLKPDTGTIKIDGQDVSQISSSQLPQYSRQIGVVYQDFKLLPDRNIWENVALPLEVRGVSSVQYTSPVKVALNLVDLGSKASMFPAQLSGGELQRVSLARAIVGKPKLLLADEPTGNLDPKTAKAIVKLLREVHSQLKTTVIMATHNAEIVNVNSQRVIALDAGKVIKDSPRGKYD